MRFSDRVVLITGAASGFGAAAARRFRSEGARLSLVDISDGGAALADELGGPSVARFARADVAIEPQVQAAFATTLDAFGRVDVVVNNAGVVGGGWIDEADATAHFERVVRINLGGVWHGCRAAVSAMCPQRSGVILNTVSAAALAPTPAAAAYGLAKAAVLHLTRSLAVGYGGSGIRVNAVLPGPTATGIFGSSLDVHDLEQLYLPNIALGRLGEVDDVVNAMLYLSSDEARFVTGAALCVDGGFQPRVVSPVARSGR